MRRGQLHTTTLALALEVAAAAALLLNRFDFIVYPITFGIAVDCGANVVARMSVRRGIAVAVREVGGVVALCSWTTMVGYGSLVLSLNQAMRSFGWYALLGEITSLTTALILLPAMARLLPPGTWTAPERSAGARVEMPSRDVPPRRVAS